MQFVQDSRVQSRFSNGFPKAIELLCPHCVAQALFEARHWQEHGRQVAAADAACPRCEGVVLLVQLLDGHDRARPGALYSDPPSPLREAMPGIERLRELSAPLGRTYESALKLYNHTEWGPAALMVRHLLEGLTTRLLGDDKRDLPLTRQLEALHQGIDTARPLHDIAPLLAPGGTFGREFEDEAAIDQATAGQLLELAEQLIAYLVVLPEAMAELKGRIATAPVPLRRGGSTSAGAIADAGARRPGRGN